MRNVAVPVQSIESPILPMRQRYEQLRILSCGQIRASQFAHQGIEFSWSESVFQPRVLYPLAKLSYLLENRNVFQATGQNSSRRPELQPFQLAQYMSLYGLNDIFAERTWQVEVPLLAK